MNRITKNIIVSLVILVLVLIVILKDRSIDIVSIRVENDFKKSKLLSQKKPVLVNLGADNCVSCFDMFSDLVHLNNISEEKFIIKFIDVLKQRDIAKDFDYTSVPTQIFYNSNGRIHLVNQGRMTKEDILIVFKEMGVKID